MRKPGRRYMRRPGPAALSLVLAAAGGVVRFCRRRFGNAVEVIAVRHIAVCVRHPHPRPGEPPATPAADPRRFQYLAAEAVAVREESAVLLAHDGPRTAVRRIVLSYLRLQIMPVLAPHGNASD